MRAAFARTAAGRVQPVFAGPPGDVLDETFALLTQSGSNDWTVDTDGAAQNVVVLLIGGAPSTTAASTILSQPCNWDYAVAIRNSVSASMTLASPEAMDSRHESIANASETLGNPRALHEREFFASDPWPFVLDRISQRTSVARSVIRQGLSIIFRQTRNLDAGLRDVAPWEVANLLLECDTPEAVMLALGLPSLDGQPLTTDALNLSRTTLSALAQLCEKSGLDEAERVLRSTGATLLKSSRKQGQSSSLVPLSAPIRRMFGHLRERAGSGAIFYRAPLWYFRPVSDTAWWTLLPQPKLQQLLEETGASGPVGSLTLTCTNAVNTGQRQPDEPYVVTNAVELEATDDMGGVPPQLIVTRRALGQPIADIPRSSAGNLVDNDTPEHDRPLTYTAESPNYRPSTVNVISLDSFGCRGYAHVNDAVSNPPPARRRGQPFEQEISVPRSGIYDLRVYAGSTATTISLTVQGVSRTDPAGAGAYALELEDGDDLQVVLRDDSGLQVGSWSIRILVQEPSQGAASSRFEALVRAHQQGRTRIALVQPTNSWVRQLETAYIQNEASWQGVVAGFSSTVDDVQMPTWPGARLGDLAVTDIRPAGTIQPPAPYLAARDTIRQMLSASRRTLAEAVLTNPGLASAIAEYVQQYRSWLASSPEAASWTDCVAIHAPTQNVQAGEETPTSEPVALLLSPMHPLRLAWHCYAQQVLETALDKTCPAAGLLDPQASPASFALPIYKGGTLLLWRAYFAVATNEVHWQLLWNRDYLGASLERTHVLRALSLLGIMPAAIAGGFSRVQARRALDEVAAILSARAGLRVGLVGSNEESSGCVDGLIEWSRAAFAVDDDRQVGILPAACDVLDLRDKPANPSPASLAILSEDTDERVRWFMKGPAGQDTQVDLVLLDQVGTLEPRGVAGDGRAALAPGSLFRVNLRRDIGQALVLKEARVGLSVGQFDGIVGDLTVATTAAEALSMRDGGTSHLEFQPNQVALAQRLDRSLFVAATSTQVDPACFIRGTQVLDSYLWDYEVPGTPGYDSSRSGYYLVAKPSPAMKSAILGTTQLVADEPPPVESLLVEISKRGIPVLKRMARGGGQARGELGVLLAVRLLQDAFRPQGGPQRLPVANGSCLHVLLPVDSYWNPFVQIRRSLESGTSEERPDLLVFSIAIQSTAVAIKVTPVEIKFRESNLSAVEIGNALRQAANLGSLLGQLWAQPPNNELWNTCAKALLAQCLDHAFRVYADPAIHGVDPEAWASWHQRVLTDVLAAPSLDQLVTVNTGGRLLVFDASATTQVVDMDADNRLDTAILSRDDARALLMDDSSLSPTGSDSVRLLDFSLPQCAGEPTIPEARPTPPPDAFPQGSVCDSASGPGEPPVLNASDETEDDGNGDDGLLGANGEESSSAVPAEIRQRVRDAFRGFIGNEAAVKRITNDLLRALIERPPHLSKNYLLTGPPSTGKTELARRMAHALRLPFVRLDGRGLSSRERLFDLINGELGQQRLTPTQSGQQSGLPLLEYPPIVVFIDEVHLVPKAVQESLLTMLEAADRTVTLNSQVAHVDKATFIFATTRASDVDAAFRSRCTEIQLREYEIGEVAEMVRLQFSAWPRDVHLEIAKLGRRVPRIALELARELETEVTVSERPNRSIQEHLEEVRVAREVDSLGLTRLDLQYLALLHRENRPVGEQPLVHMLANVDRDRIIDEVEPFLARLGFIRLGARGREITPEGRSYLLEHQRHASTST